MKRYTLNGALIGLGLGTAYWCVISWTLSNGPDMRPFLQYDFKSSFFECLAIGCAVGALTGAAIFESKRRS